MAPETPVNDKTRMMCGGRVGDDIGTSSTDVDTGQRAMSVSEVAAIFQGGTSSASTCHAPKSRSDTNIVKRGSGYDNDSWAHRKSDGISETNWVYSSSSIDIFSPPDIEEEDDAFPPVEDRGRTREHNCVESLQKLVQIQHEQIGNLESELTRFASIFGQREDALLSQISALHAEIVVFRHLVSDKRFLATDTRQPEEPRRYNQRTRGAKYKEEILLLQVEKCENGNLGFSLVDNSSTNQTNGPNAGVAGVLVDQVNPQLCTLKNGDLILKVNGRDVSGSRHSDAVEAFRTAKEPIVVQVLRRECDEKEWPAHTNNANNCPPVALVDTSTQTEWSGGWGDSPPSFPLNGLDAASFSPLGSPSRSASSLLTAMLESRATQPLQHEVDEAVEYEEVRLLRGTSSEKLGLTLCYGAPDDSDTDIYVSEVEPFSVAAKDGRIIEGDQLLRINGVQVRNREQAVSLFSEKRTDVTLLLARPQHEDEDEDEDVSDAAHDALLEEDELEDELEGAVARHDKDSGVGRTDESTKNEESSEENVEAPIATPTIENVSPDAFRQRLRSKSASTSTTNLDLGQVAGMTRSIARYQSDASLEREMALLNREMEDIQLECESLVHRHASAESRKKTNNSSPASSVAGDQLYVNLVDLQNGIRGDGVGRGGQNLAEDVNAKAGPTRSSSRVSLSKKEAVERWVKSMVFGKGRRATDPSSSTAPTQRDSAYNTGGSTPLTLELSPLLGLTDKRCHASIVSLLSPRMEDKGTQLRESDVASIFSCDSCRRCCRALVQSERFYQHQESTARRLSPDLSRTSSKAHSRLSNGRHRAASDEGSSRGSLLNKNYVSFHPCSTMYTNRANLQHTIWLQQRLFRDALKAKETLSAAGTPDESLPLPEAASSTRVSLTTQGKTPLLEDVKMEWKVKKRADGSRYIARRPARNKILKERALKINEERTGLTTDDDAVSELKVGRYWNKEERKRHLERARDRKRKEKCARGGGGVGGGASVVRDSTNPTNLSTVLELSRKKMLKKKGRAVFDDFTTVQEVLAHGNKVQGSKTLGLLSVTTV